MMMFRFIAELLGMTKEPVSVYKPSSMKRPTPQKRIVAREDVFHQERPVLLMRAGQHLDEKALVSLHQQGVDVMETCVLRDNQGREYPLEAHVLKAIVNRVQWVQRQEKQQAPVAPIQASESSLQTAVQVPQVPRAQKEATPWQRHMNVMVVSHNPHVQRRCQTYLEELGILPHRIHPVMHADTFMYAYNKHKPLCMLVDAETSDAFLCEEVDIRNSCERSPQRLEHIIVLQHELQPPLPARAESHFHIVQLTLPLQRKDIKQVFEPIQNGLKRLYFEEPTLLTPMEPLR